MPPANIIFVLFPPIRALVGSFIDFSVIWLTPLYFHRTAGTFGNPLRRIVVTIIPILRRDFGGDFEK
jgi:hypothetical protein